MNHTAVEMLFTYQQVEGDKNRAGSESNFCPRRRKLPHQEYEKGHIWHQQQDVPEAHPKGEM